jgi:hypothetical protein
MFMFVDESYPYLKEKQNIFSWLPFCYFKLYSNFVCVSKFTAIFLVRTKSELAVVSLPT